LKEAFGNLWDFYHDDPNCVVCITTNGFVKSSGEGVMGAGCAKEAAAKWPWLPRRLGMNVLEQGNVLLYLPHIRIVLFPTKKVWWEPSSITLIQQSAAQLKRLASSMTNRTIYLPRPGCSNGKLEWRYVRPKIEPILPHNVVAIDFKR
jgi:hypothetical protein